MPSQLPRWPIGVPEVCDALVAGAGATVSHRPLLIVKGRLRAVSVVVIAVVEISERAVESTAERDMVG